MSAGAHAARLRRQSRTVAGVWRAARLCDDGTQEQPTDERDLAGVSQRCADGGYQVVTIDEDRKDPRDSTPEESKTRPGDHGPRRDPRVAEAVRSASKAVRSPTPCTNSLRSGEAESMLLSV